MTGILMALAVLLDCLLGEARRAHPLVAFGRWASVCERHFYRDSIAAGALAWGVAVLPWLGLCVLLMALLRDFPWLWAGSSVLLLYAVIGLKSLGEHALPVAEALEAGDLERARSAVAKLVSRDTGTLDAEGIARAASESVLENGADAVFAALFWFALLGAPGALLYRLANTLDAMWGYRNGRYLRFGRVAARADDVLNFIPARLTALSYAMLGQTRQALGCWRAQARHWKSPNAGPVMAAGAGAIGYQLGGAASYHGQMCARPVLGQGRVADAASIRTALRLVQHGTVLWLVIALLVQGALGVFSRWHG